MLTLISLVAAFTPFIISPLLGSCLGSSTAGIAPLGGRGRSGAGMGRNRARLAQVIWRELQGLSALSESLRTGKGGWWSPWNVQSLHAAPCFRRVALAFPLQADCRVFSE